MPTNENGKVEFAMDASEADLSLQMGDGESVFEASGEDLESDGQKKVEKSEKPEGDDLPEDEADGEDEGDDEKDEGSLEDLGDFDIDNEETVSKFDAQYLTEDGFLDMEGNLSKEFWQNKAKGVDGLNEGTYAYLEARGISRAETKRIEALAVREKDSKAKELGSHDGELFAIANSAPDKTDGPERLRAAMKWAKESKAYDADAQKEFNEIVNGTDLKAKRKEVELLMSRYDRANPAPKRRLPLRDATKGQGSSDRGSVQKFKDRAEWREARKAAGDNRDALANVAKRAKASGF